MRKTCAFLMFACISWLGNLQAQCTLQLSATVTDVRCNLGSDGAISLAVANGTSPYSYSWSNGSTSATAAGLTAGQYSVTVTDALNCTASLTNIGVKQPAPFVYNVVIHNISCHGGSDGSLNFSLSGGTPPYSYVWTNVTTNTVVATTEDVTNLPMGIYGLVVTDANGCRGGIFYLLAEASPMDFQASITNVTCLGGNDGKIIVSVTGGTGTKSYSWSSGETTKSILNKPAGTYSVTVTDVNRCTAVNSFTITEPEPINATPSVTNPFCTGSDDGAIDISVSGGTFPYSFQWSTGDTTEDISGLLAGQYCVTITDNNGCISNPFCFTITDPPSITISAGISNESCPGSNDGAIDITVSGGTPPYSYTWTGGDTTEDLIGLAPGIYTVVITDANNCTMQQTFTIRTDNIFVISVGITQPLCGESNGSATVAVSGGLPPFTIQWSNGQMGATINNLPAGSYGVTVTDGNGCTASETADISSVNDLSITGNVTNNTCGSSNTGAIDITVTGGTVPYAFQWSNGAAAEDIANLAEGAYSVTVTDSSGCQEVTAFFVEEESGLNITESTIQPSCNNSDGSISISVSGGVPPYNYTWSTGQNTSTITGLGAGVYMVTVTDINGCEETKLMVLSDVTSPRVAINKTDITCNNPEGTAEVIINSGNPPFTILWSTGDTVAVISGLQPGIYTVQVTDSSGCMAVAETELNPALGIIMEAAKSEPKCNGSTDGSIDITVIQGSAPFTYQWSTGENTEDLSGIGAGTYSVTVTDSGGCTATTTVIVEEPEEITASADILEQPQCNGDSTGSIGISVTGGTVPYSYNWSNGDTSEDLSNIPAGEYCVAITDANGCVSDTFCFNLNEPPQVQIQASVTPPTCNGGDNGSISATASGGTPPYTYSWSTGDTTQNISGLSAGTYSVTAADANSCTAASDLTVTEPDSVSAAIQDSSDVKCNGANDGSVSVQASGGTPPYTYFWSNGDSSQTISGLPPGSYQVTVTDANGCSDTSDIVTITQPDSLLVTGDITQPVCDSSGFIDITVSGGTPPFDFLWSTGDTTEDLGDISGGGTFGVTVTDSNGCSASAAFLAIEPPVMDVLIEVTQELTCYGDSSGTLCARVDGVPGPYFYQWSTGDSTECVSGLPAGTYSVTVANGSGCSAYENGFILIEPNPISISPAINSVRCYGGSDGSVIVNVSNGTPPYSYQWSTGDTGNLADSLSAGTVSVTVMDANECSATQSINIPQPAPMDFSNSEVIPTTCDTIPDGSITVSVSGGTVPYIYNWDNGSSGNAISGLEEGTYTVTVTDANGCTGESSFTVDGPSCNQPPHAVDDTTRLFVCRNDSIEIVVLANDFDPDDDDIYVAAILAIPFHGTVHVNSDQSITYVPAPGYVGMDSFNYVICEIGVQPSLCDTGAVIIAVLPCRPNVIIPTGFSPNGDGTNDGFDIPGIEFFPDNRLLIFNRWGNKVRDFEGYKNQWTGTNEDDEPLPDGTYYFILELHDEENTTYTGYVVIHR